MISCSFDFKYSGEQVMKNIALIAGVVILLCACGDSQQPPQTQDEQPGEAVAPDHYYVHTDGGKYGYERALSEEDIKQGRVAAQIIMASYIGQKDGTYQVAVVEGSIYTVLESDKSCEFIKTMVFDIDDDEGALKVDYMRGQPGALAYSILQDAINGKLTSRMVIRQRGKDYAVWFDEKKGVILTEYKPEAEQKKEKEFESTGDVVHLPPRD
jgi:ferredoxin